MRINVNFFKNTRSVRMACFINYLNRKQERQNSKFLLHPECSLVFILSLSLLLFYVINSSCLGSFVLSVSAVLIDRSVDSIYSIERAHSHTYILNDNTLVQSTYLNSIFLFGHSIATRLDNSNKRRSFKENKEFWSVTYPCAPVPSNSSVNLYLSLNDISEYELAVRRFFFFCCLVCTLCTGEFSDLHSSLVVSRRTFSFIELKIKQFNSSVFFYFYLPDSFETFNDEGRFIGGGRPKFCVDVDELLLTESSWE